MATEARDVLGLQQTLLETFCIYYFMINDIGQLGLFTLTHLKLKLKLKVVKYIEMPKACPKKSMCHFQTSLYFAYFISISSLVFENDKWTFLGLLWVFQYVSSP